MLLQPPSSALGMSIKCRAGALRVFSNYYHKLTLVLFAFPFAMDGTGQRQFMVVQVSRSKSPI